MEKINVLIRMIRPLIGMALVLVTTSFAQRETQKYAQAGMKFLSVGLGARQAALADASTAIEGGAELAFYNPSGLARMRRFADVSFGTVQWIADIKHYYVAAAFDPWESDYGVFGLSFQFTDYGEVQATILANNDRGYLDVGTIKPSASVFGITYAKALSDRFAVGANVKFVTQDLGSGYVAVNYNTSNGQDEGIYPDSSREVTNNLTIPAFDFGLQYNTGFKSLVFGMTVRNFSREVKYISEGFQLPLTFRVGLAMNVLDFLEVDPGQHRFLVAIDVEHPRDYPEQIKIGVEYAFKNTISFRAGYVSPADEHDFSFGVGLQQKIAGTDFALDYSYTPYGIFTSWASSSGEGALPTVSRLSFRFGF